MVRRAFAAGLGFSVLGLGAGCARQPTPAVSAVDEVTTVVSASARTVGTPCDLSGGRGATDTAPGVFIELAGAQGDLDALFREHPPLPPASNTAPTAGIEAFVGDPRLKNLSVMHVLTPTDVPQTVPWEFEGQAGERQALHITMTPHVNGPAPAGLSIEVDVRGQAHTTVVLHDQQSIVLGGFSAPVAAGTQALFVLTPYVMWNDADFGRLLACKQRRAHAGVAGGPALP